jgi:flagellar basal-body rod protein FlgB
MIEALFVQPSYLAAKKMLDVSVLRHEAIASNLGNIETPNYRRVDVDTSFAHELQQAIAGSDSGRIAALKPALVTDLNAKSSRRDGNTVELETELINLSQNTVAHAAEAQLITSSLTRLRMAITGRTA